MKSTRQVLLGVLLLALVVCSWLGPLDTTATEQVDAGLKRALVSFATARVFNGVISVVQGTQVAVQPFGVGVTLTLGQILAPINELVKHFADLMLMASVAFGIQKVLISIGSYWLISLLLSAAVLGWTWFLFREKQAPSWLSRLLVILLMVRYAIPMATIGTEILSQKFLAADYASSQQAIDSSSAEMTRFSSQVAADPDATGLLSKLKVPTYAELKAHFEKLKKTVTQATEHIIKLMVIFLLQTLLIPILLLWALYGFVRGTFESLKTAPSALR